MILAQDVGYKLLNSFSPRDLGKPFEQGCSNAERMIWMGYHRRDFSDFRVLADDYVMRYPDQPVSVERAKSVPSRCRVSHHTDKLVDIDGVQREEPEVSIMVAEALMERQRALLVVNGEAA